jgi:integrase
MNYLIKRVSRFYYNRRVPKHIQILDSRPLIRIALKTDSRKIAQKLAAAHNEAVEAYWLSLLQSGQQGQDKKYNDLIQHARLLGYSYSYSPLLAEYPLDQIIDRARHVENHLYNEKHVASVLGGQSAPKFTIEEALERYWELSKDKILNKSPNQIRKWENPRKKAILNFIKCIGNKPVHELTREDTLKFRAWWINRIDKENYISGTANKDLIYVKVIISTIAENYRLPVDYEHLFKKLVLTKDDSVKRLPFETDYIIKTLLNPDNLKGLNEQARWVLYAFSETGAGLAELTGLLPEDIVLDHEIPHIKITPRAKKALKTKFRARAIPLVGFALDAFKACPNGFTDYKDSPDFLSSVLSKYLNDHKLLPTNQHTVYSLRHSFQDRLLAVNAPDRVQADLMGHKFNRQAYGNGATLGHKLEWLNKIRLKPE